MFDKGKNQVGEIVVIGAISCFFFGMKFKEERLAYWVISLLALLCLILIRARSSFFALILVGVLIAVKEFEIHWTWNTKNVLTIFCVIFIGVIIYTGFISDELHTFMFGGKDVHDINDITSDRWSRNQEGLSMLSQRNMIDETTVHNNIPYIHNYPLLRVVRYGLYSVPLLAFYIFFGVSTIIEIFKTKKTHVKQAGWIVCCVPLLVSFFEPNFPYGPGIVQLFAFLLLGFSLNSSQKKQIPLLFQSIYNNVLHRVKLANKTSINVDK